MHVEDHPIDYGSFEGNIPKGEYGGGSVMLWIWGAVDNLRRAALNAVRIAEELLEQPTL